MLILQLILILLLMLILQLILILLLMLIIKFPASTYYG